MKTPWNILVAVLTAGGLLFFAQATGTVHDKTPEDMHTALYLLLLIYGIVVANWGLIASTFYDRLTALKRTLLAALCLLPFVLYEVHAPYFPPPKAVYYRGGGLIASEYWITFAPPALCGVLVLAAGRSLPGLAASWIARAAARGRRTPSNE
jgi:hypothetical protein